jgi:hypothetical protein
MTRSNLPTDGAIELGGYGHTCGVAAVETEVS